MTSPSIISSDIRLTPEFEDFNLNDRYLKDEGIVLMSGVQALVRLPIDQHKADVKAGINSATLISGYRGSPLGGYDALIQKNATMMQKHNIEFIPAVNEDLGATTVHGAQIANLLPNPKYDGVVGIWYGKAPGVDRSGDIFKHANMIGTGKFGGVLAIAGDDPMSKSSTLPSHSEVALFDAQMPILYPGNVEEILILGRLGIELSRYCGLWVGMKVVTDVADGFATVRVKPIDDIKKPNFQYNGVPWEHKQNHTLLPEISLQLEKELYEARNKAAVIFARANRLNNITHKSNNDQIGIITAGKTYYDIIEAFNLLGLSENKLEEKGIRILKLQLLYPMDSDILQEFAQGLNEILVIEEKRGFIELMVRDALFNLSNHPKITGKYNLNGEILVPANGEILVKDILEIIIRHLENILGNEIISNYNQRVDKQLTSFQLSMVSEVVAPRTPYFCSGCPHNLSTNIPTGSLSGGGIGCHALSLLMDRETIGLLHMGAEGVSWVGASLFSEIPHMYQNMGDGTLFHSGYLAIRQAIARNTNITYKILYNSVVAMTGGQVVDGAMLVPELTRALEAEGTKQIIVCSDDVSKYGRKSRWAKNVKIWHRSELEKAQLELQKVEGVTIVIYDHPCALDIRRKRRKNLVPTPDAQIFINELVCEGCGDCGVKSNCLSVLPVDTEFGRKTQIHQSSCNRDYTCLDGDCPAFVTVIPKGNVMSNTKNIVGDEIFSLGISEPEVKVPQDTNIFMVGIGGTGVVTINQIFATAAYFDGKYSTNLDQTGLSQKGGMVSSHIKLSRSPLTISNRVPSLEANALILFDILGGVTEANLSYAHPNRTIAIVSTSKIATGLMVKSKELIFPQQNILLQRLEGHIKEMIQLDAKLLSESLFGDHLPSNIMVMGAAYQAGAIPITQSSIFKAIEVNGVAVDTNKKAFLIGRLTVTDPTHYLQTLEFSRQGDLHLEAEFSEEARGLLDSIDAEGTLQELLAIRIPELIEYQNYNLAKSYADFIKDVKNKEEVLDNENLPFTESVVRYLFKLMAYKDEYEVARLYLKSEFTNELKNNFGENVKITYNLHPPLLRSLGKKNKITLGSWFKFGLRILFKFKRIRGTPLDLFGYAKIRKMERFLIKEYMDIISKLSNKLTKYSIDLAVQVAELPDMIRGYESIKERNVELYHKELERLLGQ